MDQAKWRKPPSAPDAKAQPARSHRLTVPELEQALDSVAQACSERLEDRSGFGKWKQQFSTRGFEGLKGLPPINKSRAAGVSDAIAARICSLALAHPAFGTARLETTLALEGIGVSPAVIQQILEENDLGTRVERWLMLETAGATGSIVFSAEQVAFLEKLNPCFRERNTESAAPGELIAADTFFVGSIKGAGKVYMHAVVDTYCGYAFGFLHATKQPEASVALLHNDVLPFYKSIGLQVIEVLTDNGREFCGTRSHAYELYLDLNEIRHRRAPVRTQKISGFVERFNAIVLDEFFRVILRSNAYETIQALQSDLDAWMRHYNTERPLPGYRNMGLRPIERIASFVETHT